MILLPDKKYLSISEVSDLLKVSVHTLRYIEKKYNIKLNKIRGRKYYLAKDIQLVIQILNIDKKALDNQASKISCSEQGWMQLKSIALELVEIKERLKKLCD